jgi:condensation domain-containing protein/AMP-binding enzyme
VSEARPLRFPHNEKARQLASVLSKKGMPGDTAISPRPVYSPCPASFAQQRFWLLEQMSPGSRFNLQVVLRFERRLNLQTLNAAWREILKRHEILRTTFGMVDDQLMQFIASELKPSPTVVDLAHENAGERESLVRHLVRKQGQEPFDLANGPLVRPVLFQLSEEQCLLSLTMHHIISDGWSMAVLERELTELYLAFSEGRPSPFPPLAIQYADFAGWQREYVSGALLEKQLGYWRKQLSDAPVSQLPADHPRSQRETPQGSHSHFRIPEAVAGQLRELGRRNQASLFMVLLAAWQVLLYRYSTQSDVVVGAPVANRTRLEIEPLIGFFVNTLVLRTDLSGNPAFKEVLTRVRKTTLDAYEHQDVPYEKLVAEIQPQRAASQTPFFGTVLNWVNTPASSALTGMECESTESAAIQFDLALNVVETNGALPVLVEYSTELYEAATITRLVQHLQNLLSGILANPEEPISGLPVMDQEERNQLLFARNQTGALHFTNETMLELLEEQARKTPEHSAVVFEGKSLSYRELHRQANQVANFLRK